MDEGTPRNCRRLLYRREQGCHVIKRAHCGPSQRINKGNSTQPRARVYNRALCHFEFSNSLFSTPQPLQPPSPHFNSSINMSGRGKGGKGLGKGGAKRHRKILRDNIQGMYLDSNAFNLVLILRQVSPSPLFVVLPAEVVSSVSPVSSTKRPVVFSRSSSRT